MTADPYTCSMRLCDDDGMVSDRRIPSLAGVSAERTFLDRLNNLRRNTLPYGDHRPVTEPFACTGSAHLAGEHIRCLSPAHLPPILMSATVSCVSRETLDRLCVLNSTTLAPYPYRWGGC